MSRPPGSRGRLGVALNPAVAAGAVGQPSTTAAPVAKARQDGIPLWITMRSTVIPAPAVTPMWHLTTRLSDRRGPERGRGG
ncbi:MAG: hypothetical protein ACR2LS_10085 [Thermomicrobiales bacterium]